MSKIPTAREFYDHHPSDDTVIMMIDFAKLHVERALKEAADQAETYDYPYLDCCSQCGHTATYVNQDSILNAYPLDNIK